MSANLALAESVPESVAKAVICLSRAGISDPKDETLRLWSYVERTYSDATPAQRTTCFEGLIRQRASRVPLGYLLRSATLMGLSFDVGPGVFVPRPESEPYLSAALHSIAEVPRPSVFDLFSGCAALALIIANRRPDAKVTAVERGDDAMLYAEANARARLCAGDRPIALRQADVADDKVFAPFSGSVDLVTANPPYVPIDRTLRPEYERFQPSSAIFSGADGLDAARASAQAAAITLRPGGQYFVEHSDDQEDAVRTLLLSGGRFESVSCYRDHRGLPRWSRARRTGGPA